MNKFRFWWDARNVEHIADHGVEPYEAEEVIDDDPFVAKAGQGKYLAYEMQKLPEFESDEELAAWIDQHDTSPYMDDMEEVGEKFEVIRTLFATKPVDVRLRADYLDAIQAIAERKGIPYQRLVQTWLLEKLRQEAPDLVA